MGLSITHFMDSTPSIILKKILLFFSLPTPLWERAGNLLE